MSVAGEHVGNGAGHRYLPSMTASRERIANVVNGVVLGAIFYLAAASVESLLSVEASPGNVFLNQIEPQVTLAVAALSGVAFELLRRWGLVATSPYQDQSPRLDGVPFGVGFAATRVLRESVVYGMAPLSLAAAAHRLGFVPGVTSVAIGGATVFVFEGGLSRIAAWLLAGRKRQMLATLVAGRAVFNAIEWMLAASVTLRQLLAFEVIAAVSVAGVAWYIAVRDRPSKDPGEPLSAKDEVAAIALEHVGYRYPTRDKRPQSFVLDDFSIQIARGGVVALLGHNGAGKTTLLRIFAGLLTDYSGVAMVEGADTRAKRRLVSTLLGFAAEEPAAPPHATIREHLGLIARLHGLSAEVCGERIDQLLEFFALTELADRPIGTLSRGVRQRIGLARALVHRPRVILLDEPGAALDPLTMASLRRLLVALKRGGATIVVATHNLHEACRISDEIVLMRAGRMIARGAPDILLGPGEGVRYSVSFALSASATLEELEELIIRLGLRNARLEPGRRPEEVRLSFETDSPEQDNPKVVEALIRKALKPYRMAEEVDLEERYLALLRKQPEADATEKNVGSQRACEPSEEKEP